jgi:thiosulfate/3-mercaptopyruvate sulfurtransferase
MALQPLLIQPAELAAVLHRRSHCVVDFSFHLASTGRNARAEFLARRIPGAFFADIEEACEKSSSLPHQLPTAAHLEAYLSSLGVDLAKPLVAYDAISAFSAPFLSFMLRSFGKRDVQVLDGGLPRWIAFNLPLETGEPHPPAPQAAGFGNRGLLQPAAPGLIRGLKEVVELSRQRDHVLIDARPAVRFAGGPGAAERPGVRIGHVPGAKSVPWATVLGPDGAFKPAEEITKTINDAIGQEAARSAREVTLMCGSGVSAAVVHMAMELSKSTLPKPKIYNGSWTEYGRTELPLERD